MGEAVVSQATEPSIRWYGGVLKFTTYFGIPSLITNLQTNLPANLPANLLVYDFESSESEELGVGIMSIK